MSNTFSEEEIQDIYSTHVKLPASYFQPLHANTPPPFPEIQTLWTTGDYPRVRCIIDFQKWVEKYNLKNPNHLGYTCADDPELLCLYPSHSTKLSYPPFDLHEIGQYSTGLFDMFLFNQTLEHLYNPFKAVEQIYTIVKPGGVVFTSVPTLAIPHSTPIHFAGFTPMGLAMLFRSAGFEILEMGQWGSQLYILENWKKLQWPGAVDLAPLYPDNMIPNEESYCVQCWILAKRSE